MRIELYRRNKDISGELLIPGSKSVSNRVLIIRALCRQDLSISNLSPADDTVILKKLLETATSVYYAGDGGTTVRFLIPYLCLKEGEHLVSGSESLSRRPVALLIESLRQLGAEIEYVEEEGRLPIRIKSCRLRGGKISIDASVSSQFVSALMLVAPTLEGGLEIHLDGDIASKSYILLTADIQKQFGIDVKFRGKAISIPQGKYIRRNFEVEGDWSTASFFIGLAALSDQCLLELKGLNLESLQADKGMMEFMKPLGLNFDEREDELIIKKVKDRAKTEKFVYDLRDCPDLFPPLAIVYPLKNKELELKGLETLVYKESNRLSSIKDELSKLNIEAIEGKGSFHIKGIRSSIEGIPEFDSHNDHRIAMACALVSMETNVIINDAEVVTKSDPQYWEQLERLGFEIKVIRD